jgi:hypothetical protein
MTASENFARTQYKTVVGRQDYTQHVLATIRGGMMDQLLTAAHVWHKPQKALVVLSVALVPFVSNR